MLALDIQSILNSIPHEIPWQDIANTDERPIALYPFQPPNLQKGN